MGLKLVILCLLTMVLVSMGQASPSIGQPVTWDGTSDPGWTSLDAWATVSEVSSGGNPLGYLQINYDVVPPNVPQNDIVYNSGLSYSGDYSSLGVSFDYLSTNNSLQTLYFKSGVDNSTWKQVFTTPSTSWERISLSFYNSANWVSLDNLVNFEVARTNVNQFGFFIQTPSDPGSYTFGIDNLEFNNNYTTQVPEPSTVILLVSVVLCLCVTFRVDRMVSGKIR